MRILYEVGIKFHHKDAIDVLKRNGVETDGDVAKFNETQIMKWIEKAPKVAPLYARNSKYDMQIGGDNVYPAPCYGAASVTNADGTSRAAVMKDYTDFAKLFHTSPFHNINGGVLVQPDDIPIKESPQILHYAAALLSDKCLIVSSGTEHAMESLMKMTGVMFDGAQALAEKPRILTIVNANAPLQIDKTMLETLFTFAKHGQPFVMVQTCMAGTISPVTMAGTLAIGNAEVLAGIALSQMIRPGAPVIYASQTAAADMRSGFMASGAPEGALAYRNCTIMAKHYGLPCRGGGAVTDAPVVGAQSGYESMMNYLICSQSKMNLIIHSAGILESYAAVSFEKAICDFEIIGMVNKFLEGIDFSEDAIPFDLIKEAGHGGQYMTSDHTLEHFRALFTPDISIRGKSQNAGQFDKNISGRLRQMLDSYKRPDFDADKLRALEKLLLDEGVEQGLLDKIKSHI